MKSDKYFSKIRSKIKLLVFDFDGVLTDNKVIVRSDGLESVFNHLEGSPTQSVQNTAPVSRNKEVDALLEKMSSTETTESSGGCGGTVVKLFIFIWIFSLFSDLCS